MSAFSHNARSLALRALSLVDAGRPVQSVFQFLNLSRLSSAERRLLSDLVYGCLRAELRIHFLLSRVLPSPENLPRGFLHILELAVYAMLFQEKVPDYAAISTAVAQARRLFGMRLAGVANAALRKLQGFGDLLFSLDFYCDEAVAGGDSHIALSRFYSLPPWLVSFWFDVYGPAAALAIIKRSFARPWTGLRLNPAHPSALRLQAALLSLCEDHAVPLSPWGFAVAPHHSPSRVCGETLHHWQDAGALAFQSAGSQIILEKLGVYDWEGPVWDACAGYGGKASALRERGIRVCLCTDISLQRLAALAARFGRRCELPTVLADCRCPPVASFRGHILLDAPCSGLGILARRPDIRRARPDAASLSGYAVLQKLLLQRLAGLLQPGFELAYITCTLAPPENEGMIQSCLAADASLRLVRQWQTPHEHPWLEGMFGAILRKD